MGVAGAGGVYYVEEGKVRVPDGMVQVRCPNVEVQHLSKWRGGGAGVGGYPDERNEGPCSDVDAPT